MTKPTNEERREVAERLRNMTCRDCRYAEQFYELLKETVMNVWDFHEFDDVADRLADLIEPEPERTCRKLPPLNSDDMYTLTAKYASGFEYSETLAYARCSECGTHFCADFAYCPECGAKEAGR